MKRFELNIRSRSADASSQEYPYPQTQLQMQNPTPDQTQDTDKPQSENNDNQSENTGDQSGDKDSQTQASEKQPGGSTQNSQVGLSQGGFTQTQLSQFRGSRMSTKVRAHAFITLGEYSLKLNSLEEELNDVVSDKSAKIKTARKIRLLLK